MPHETDRQPVLHNEQIGRPYAEHDGGMTVDAVTQPTQRRAREILLYGQRVDVAHPAAIKISGCRMMSGVGASPKIVRRQCQHPDHATHPVIGAAAMEEGAVTAIVLDHEQPYQKARGRHREQQAGPIAKIEGYPHQKPEHDQRPGCDDELDDAACGVRSAIARQGLGQAAGIERSRDQADVSLFQ